MRPPADFPASLVCSPAPTVRRRMDAVVARWIAAGLMKAPTTSPGQTSDGSGNPAEGTVQPAIGLHGKQAS